MNSNLIAETVFWATLASIVLAIYQSAILPSIRLQIRCEIFQLRDRLRQLVISGKVSESDKAFILLHDQLNFLACNLFRYDLLRVTQSINNMTRDQTTRVEVCVKIMEEADEDIRAIYRESVGAMMRTIVFNSLFFFAFVSVGFAIVLLCQVGLLHVRQAYKRRIEQESRVALALPEVAAVAV
jgi:hypothetical protein